MIKVKSILLNRRRTTTLKSFIQFTPLNANSRSFNVIPITVERDSFRIHREFHLIDNGSHELISFKKHIQTLDKWKQERIKNYRYLLTIPPLLEFIQI